MRQNKFDKILLTITENMAKIPTIARKHRLLGLVFFLLFTIFTAIGLPRMQLDQSLESFLTHSDPALKSYQIFKYLFGGDEYMLLMYEAPDGDILSDKALRKVKELEDEINRRRLDPKSELFRVTRVRSIISADYLKAKNNTLINRKFIGNRFPKTNAERELLRKLAIEHKQYPGNYFSKDFKFGTIMMRTDYGTKIVDEKKESKKKMATGSKSNEFDFESTEDISNEIKVPKLEQPQMSEYGPFIDELKEVLSQFNWKDVSVKEKGKQTVNYFMTGNPWIMDFFDKVIMSDMGFIGMISISIIVFTLAFAFRSFSAMLWPTLIIILSVIWDLGLIAWIGLIMSMMINIVIFLNLTVGIAASIHILSGYRYFLAEGLTQDEALEATYRKSGLSIMLASITTMAGMISLIIVPIVYIENFSITATLGVFFAFVGTIFLLPILLSFWSPKLKISKENNQGERSRIEKWFQNILENIFEIVQRRKNTISVIFLIIALLSATGFSRVVVDTNFFNMVNKGYGFVEANLIIDKYFGGTATAEIIIDTKKLDGMKDITILNAMDKLSNKILKERPDFIARNNSLVKAVKESYKHLTDNKEINYRIPETNDKLKQVLITYDSADPETRKLFVDNDWRVGRLTMQSYSKGSSEYMAFIKDVKVWIKDCFKEAKAVNPKLNVSLTGMMPLIMRMTEIVTEAQIRSFALALCIVCVILLIIYGSIKFGLLALVPNIFPIAVVVVVGMIGWLNIPLDSDTLLVMPIAIGIALDDSIHFLTHYRTEILRGKSQLDAIKISLKEVGQAIIFTSVILSLGYLAFIFSAYKPFNNFGFLSAVAILSAIMADLFLLPSLLLIFQPFKREVEESIPLSEQVS